MPILLASPENKIKLANQYRANGDFDRAIFGYRSAANNGMSEAMFYLGRAYENGEGVGKDTEKAIQYYLDASNYGLSEAQMNLGVLFKERGKEGDAEKAVQWTKKAAEAGEVDACSNLAKWYLEGKIVQKDLSESLKWRGIAAKAGDGIACYQLALHYLDGIGVGKNIEMAEENFKKAFITLSKKENHRNLSAVLTLANMYRKGRGTSIDYEKALEYYYLANHLADEVGVQIKQDVVLELENGIDSKRVKEIKNLVDTNFK